MQIHSQLGDSYFLISNPDMAGSPPRRVPPPINIKRTTNYASRSSTQPACANSENVTTYMNDYGLNHKATPTTSARFLGNLGIPPLGLPSLKTGIDWFTCFPFDRFLLFLILFDGLMRII